MSFAFTESVVKQFEESPCLVARLGSDPRLTRGVLHVAQFFADVIRYGIAASAVAAYGNTTASNFSETTGNSSSDIAKGKAAFRSRVTTYRVTPDPYSLTGYSEVQYSKVFSKHTGVTESETTTTTNGSGEGAAQTSAYAGTLSESVAWGASNVDVTKTSTSTGKLVYMYQFDDGLGGYYYSNTNGPGGTGYGDVSFDYSRITVWSDDYLWDDCLTDVRALWTDMVATTNFYTSGYKYKSYDDDGDIVDVQMGTNANKKSDAPTSYSVNGEAVFVLANNGGSQFAIHGARMRISGDMAHYKAVFVENDPPTSSPASYISRTSTIIPPTSSELVFLPTSGEVADIGTNGAEWIIGTVADYLLDVDWSAPS